jgi:hypothetical protein
MTRTLVLLALLALSSCTHRTCVRSHQYHSLCINMNYLALHDVVILEPCTETACDEYQEEP